MATALSTTETATRLRLAITRTARRLRQESGAGIGPSLVAALSSIDRDGPLSPSALADVEAIKRPAATRLISKLEDRGLVTRSPDPDDGRVCHVSATRAGHELLEAIRTRKSAYLADRLGDLEEHERATLAKAADLLERLLEEERR